LFEQPYKNPFLAVCLTWLQTESFLTVKDANKVILGSCVCFKAWALPQQSGQAGLIGLLDGMSHRPE
jgi:hypothetical protein